MDIVSKEQRSRIMAAVRQRDTPAELSVRRVAHALGFRFKLNVRSLPGSPDIVFHKHRKVIFVHGCYWHRHTCRKATMPASRIEFWKAKFDANVRRDLRVIKELRKLGWKVLVIWECQTNDVEKLRKKIEKYFDNS
jgi:DNA mismatch endonuclease, patch repair protein